MRRRLEPRLLAAILAGLALALGLAASVLALGMQRQAVDAALPRLAFVAAEVGGTIEGGLGLGFALDQLGRTQGMIDGARAEDGDIQSIVVFDERGRAVFSTDAGEVGETVPAAWQGRQPGEGERIWTATSDDGVAVGVPLSNSFGAPAGGVVLRYPAARIAQQVAGVWATIGTAALVLFAAAAPFALLVAWLAAGRLRAGLDQAATCVAQAAEPGPDVPLADELRAFQAHLATAGAHLRSVERELTQLDGMA